MVQQSLAETGAPSNPQLNGLTREQIEALRALHKLNGFYTLKVPVLYGLAALLGWAMIEFPYWYVRVPGYFAMATIMAGLGILLHEGAHGLLFESRFWNRLVSQIIAGTMGVAFTQFRYSHIFHHRDAMNDQDRDRLFYLRNIPYTILNGGRALYASTVEGLKTASRRHRVMYYVELIMVLGTIAAIVTFIVKMGWFDQFVHVYLIPFLIFPAVLIARLLLEHYDCEPDNDYTLSRTIKSNPVTEWLYSDVNYHTIHHFWQRIPWYNLKKAHYLIEPHLVANGALIDEGGYLKVLFGALRKYRFQRPPYWSFPPKKAIVWKKRKPSLNLDAREA